MIASDAETLLSAWVEARSIARGIAKPVRDRGGLRVETGSDTEVRRWVFARDCEGLRELGREIAAPRHFLKLLASSEELRGAVGPRWDILPESYFMTVGDMPPGEAHVQAGYELRHELVNGVHEIRILAPDGALAASGYAAETARAFVYDRIVTQPGHMRRGLGSAVMRTLGGLRANPQARQLLVATEAGRQLYERLGWTVIGPYATAGIADANA